MVVVQVKRDFKEIGCAHYLNGLEEGHKCGRLHGHNYTCEVTVRGPINSVGMVLDAAEIDKAVIPLWEKLDHQVLNELPYAFAAQPTAENIAIWLWNNAIADLPQIQSVKVHENGRLCAEVVRV